VQDEFHIEAEAKTQNDRKPLQVQIDANERRLTAINSELQGVDQTLDNLKRQRNTTHARIDAVKAEMAKSGVSLPKCSQSPLTTSIQALCQRYNALAAADNALTDEYNGTASRRNNLADEHNRVVVVTNNLIEALNWTRW
jgi:seryl-tRNA synthetase